MCLCVRRNVYTCMSTVCKARHDPESRLICDSRSPAYSVECGDTVIQAIVRCPFSFARSPSPVGPIYSTRLQEAKGRRRRADFNFPQASDHAYPLLLGTNHQPTFDLEPVFAVRP